MQNINDFHYSEYLTEEDLKNIKYVHFNNYNNNSIKNKFNTYLTLNLLKKNILFTGYLSQKRSYLLERLKIEHELIMCKCKLEYGLLDKKTFYCAEDEFY